VDSGKAEDIVNALINHLQKNKIDIKKLNGIGSDNASTMVGSARGVYEIIKTKFHLPKLVQSVYKRTYIKSPVELCGSIFFFWPNYVKPLKPAN
jgi:hypothetical protein